MKELPLVSVIIPVYKVEKYLRCCLDSVLSQTYPNLEIILVDDGSPDGCPAICDAYAKKDSRITVIHKKNGGASSARNTGLRVMHGEYVAFIDADDFVRPVYLEQLMNYTAGGAEVVICDFRKVPSDAENTGEEATDTHLQETAKECVTGLEANKRICNTKHRDYIRTVIPWAKVIKKDLLSGIYFPENLRKYEDEAICYRYLYKAEKVVYLDAVLYSYRDTPNSVMNSKFSDKEFDFLDILDKRARFYLSRGEQELADRTIQYWYWKILSCCRETILAGEKLQERRKKLHRAMKSLCKMALGRSGIPIKTKLRYLFSVPFLETASRRYAPKQNVRNEGTGSRQPQGASGNRGGRNEK